jgi:hypothetical protein
MENNNFSTPYYPSETVKSKQLEDEHLIKTVDDYQKGKLFELKYKGEVIGRLEYYKFKWYGGCYMKGLNKIPDMENIPSNYFGAKLDKLDITGFRVDPKNGLMFWYGYKHYNAYGDNKLPTNLYYTREQVANDIIGMYHYLNNKN